MEYPRCKLFVDPTGETEAVNNGVRKVCKAVVKEWSNLDESLLEISHLSGGITNLLLKVEVKDDRITPQSVTFRIFGVNTDAIIDRQRELQVIIHLTKADIGPKLIGVFENGTVQAFITARTLNPPDMAQPDLAARIAKELRKLHDTEVPLSREPQLWPDITRFMDKASTVSFDDPVKQEIFQRISFPELREEIDQLKRASKSLDAPVVFAHNDLLSGNIMYNEELDEMFLLDFEYSTYSYRGYDIANHFNEYAGFEGDYSLYPNKDAQYQFFRHYLDGSCPHKVSDSQLEELYIETNCYALCSHLYWAVWAIVQARYSTIDFDYLEYFFVRYDEYKRKKTEFLSLIPSQLISE